MCQNFTGGRSKAIRISVYGIISIRIMLISIVHLILFSCSPQVYVTKYGYSKKSYPPREDNDSVVIYKKAQDIPIDSEQIGRLQAICAKGMKNCDSVSIFSIAETKIKKAGGNALLITEFKKPTFWNNFKLLLNGDVFFVSDFSSPPDTASFMKNHMLYMGFGAGPETGISLIMPKVSYYNFHNRKKIETYYGIEGCIGMIMNAYFSLEQEKLPITDVVKIENMYYNFEILIYF